jgi:hypothetical protein
MRSAVAALVAVLAAFVVQPRAPGLGLPAAGSPPQTPARLSDSAFAALVARLSESGGYFDTDNLISNEDSYLHPVDALRRLGVSGGVYVGVGPDQNFSYIAAVRPKAAFIVDIRRDNLLEHLLFKALFALSRNRADYVSLLFGRAPPRDTTGWGARDAELVLRYVDTVRTDSATTAYIAARVLAQVRRSAVPLSAADLATLARFHRAFIAQGTRLRFNTFGRAPNPRYPDFRRLALETDRTGRPASFLARETDFAFVRELQERNLVVPVVGDFGGEKALAAVGRWIRDHGERVSVLYTSNVEQYLFRDGRFARFARTAAAFPRDGKSLIIRSCFVCRGGHPHAVAGYYSVQLVQRLEGFVSLLTAGQLSAYADILTRELIDP